MNSIMFKVVVDYLTNVAKKYNQPKEVIDFLKNISELEKQNVDEIKHRFDIEAIKICKKDILNIKEENKGLENDIKKYKTILKTTQRFISFIEKFDDSSDAKIKSEIKNFLKQKYKLNDKYRLQNIELLKEKINNIENLYNRITELRNNEKAR